MQIVLNEDGDAAFRAVKALPQTKSDGAGDGFFSGGAFNGAELFKLSHHKIIGQNSPFVVAAGDIRDQAALVQRHHNICAVAVYFRPQCSGECHFQAVRRRPEERRLWKISGESENWGKKALFLKIKFKPRIVV